MDPDYKDIINSIGDLHKLQQQVITLNISYFESEVNTIVDNESKDENRICHLLDALLDFAFDDKILVVFKKLCRYYFDNTYHGDTESTECRGNQLLTMFSVFSVSPW